LKKFFANLIFIISTILSGAVIIPWNNLVQWGIPVTQLTTYELYIKGGIGVLLFVFGLIFLIVSIHDQNNFGEVKTSVSVAAFAPTAIAAIGAVGYAAVTAWYLAFRSGANLLLLNVIFYGIAFIAVLFLIIIHFSAKAFSKGGGFKKVILFLLNVLLIGSGGFAGYFIYNFTKGNYPGVYENMYTYMYFAILAAAILIYVLHLVIISIRVKKLAGNVDLEETVKEIRKEQKPQEKSAEKPSRNKKEEVTEKQSGNKTMIVSKEQTIISGENNVDPTEVLYEDVPVDSEFNKTANADKQVSSIEYYIEKPKMFKPLDPAFDQLVAHVRELPNVVTKLADERITFYVDRKPFLVLMNFGNYYRMAFRSELEKGIRLIIKYPTISKNKGTKDNLWFKANNYGDLPKDVIYDIVKTAYDNVHA